MKRRTRPAAKARRSERLAQAKADAEVRADWLATVHGSRETLVLVAGCGDASKAIRQQIILADETPIGITHAMLRAAAERLLG